MPLLQSTRVVNVGTSILFTWQNPKTERGSSTKLFYIIIEIPCENKIEESFNKTLINCEI